MSQPAGERPTLAAVMSRLEDAYNATSVAGWQLPLVTHASTFMAGAWDIEEQDGTRVAMVADPRDAEFIAAAIEHAVEVVSAAKFRRL